jgi:hypothetical protein
LRDDRARLEDVLRAISHIERYGSRGRSGFDRDFPLDMLEDE